MTARRLAWIAALAVPALTAAAGPVAAQEAEAVLARVNGVRIEAGIRPLRPHEALDRAARGHALELARRNTLDHASTDTARATMEQRVQLAGIVHFRLLGENLAFTQNPPDPLEQVVVDLWMNSPDHRANLLERRFDHAGTGVARSADGTWYVVQLYAAGIRVR